MSSNIYQRLSHVRFYKFKNKPFSWTRTKQMLLFNFCMRLHRTETELMRKIMDWQSRPLEGKVITDSLCSFHNTQRNHEIISNLPSDFSLASPMFVFRLPDSVERGEFLIQTELCWTQFLVFSSCATLGRFLILSLSAISFESGNNDSI